MKMSYNSNVRGRRRRTAVKRCEGQLYVGNVEDNQKLVGIYKGQISLQNWQWKKDQILQKLMVWKLIFGRGLSIIIFYSHCKRFMGSKSVGASWGKRLVGTFSRQFHNWNDNLFFKNCKQVQSGEKRMIEWGRRSPMWQVIS